VKQISKRLTYANVMSSIAVFLVLGGATALAAGLAKNSVGSKQLKKNAVTSAKIKNNAVTGAKVKDGSLSGSDINPAGLGTVPTANNAAKAANADNADKLNGLSSSAFVAKSNYMWAIVDEDGNLVNGSGAVSAESVDLGEFRITFNRTVTECAAGGTATDISGGAAPGEEFVRIVGTDNREQEATNTVDVTLTDTEGNTSDPAGGDGFMVTVSC
jgi:hypothetical protein